MVKPNKKERDLARELLVEGRAVEEAASLTKLPVEQVKNIKTWLDGKMGQRWLEEAHPDKIGRVDPTSQEPQGPEIAEQEVGGEEPLPPSGPQVAAVPGDDDSTLAQQLREAQQRAQSPPPSQYQPRVTYVATPPQRPTRRMAVIEETAGYGTRIVQMMPPDWALPGPDTLEVPSNPTGGKGSRGTVNITPWTLVWFDTVSAEYQLKMNEPYPGGLPQFLEDSVIGFMQSRNRKFVYMEGA